MQDGEKKTPTKGQPFTQLENPFVQDIFVRMVAEVNHDSKLRGGTCTSERKREIGARTIAPKEDIVAYRMNFRTITPLCGDSSTHCADFKKDAILSTRNAV